MGSYQDGFRKSFRYEQPPCLNCERRGCGSYHDICPEYKQYKDEVAKNKQLRRNKNTGRDFIKDSTFKSRTSGQFRSHKK